MKLITKTTLLYLVIIALVITACGFILYALANNFIQKQTNEYFSFRETRVIKGLSEPIPNLELVNSFKSQLVVPMPHLRAPAKKPYERDTLLLNEMSGEVETFRARTFDKLVNGKVYRVSIYVAMQQSILLNKVIIQSSIYIFLALMVVLLLLNYLSSRYLWHPFNHTLEAIKNYSVNQNQPLDLSSTSTQEFRELNLLFAQMVSRIETDYRNMKEFTENISHEVQTPLAVIKAKVEMLMKSGNLPEEQFQAVNAVYQSTSRLSKLSKTLGLISKINNQEFIKREHILLKPFISNLLFDFKELAELKEITIKTELHEEASVFIDGYLLDVLLSNLLKNALTHNHREGEIIIKLTREKLLISNTGHPLTFPESQIFDRFRKNPDKPQSLGLGLAIVKRICDLNEMGITYKYVNQLHIFDLTF